MFILQALLMLRVCQKPHNGWHCDFLRLIALLPGHMELEDAVSTAVSNSS